ncbi:hypothetical protein BT69DRAFT_1281148 [Atractiella rhizophila]|nr:hypothetical protein BT69DRAFT_1281148 [Atractiella rhizophila]
MSSKSKGTTSTKHFTINVPHPSSIPKKRPDKVSSGKGRREDGEEDSGSDNVSGKIKKKRVVLSDSDEERVETRKKGRKDVTVSENSDEEVTVKKKSVKRKKHVGSSSESESDAPKKQTAVTTKTKANGATKGKDSVKVAKNREEAKSQPKISKVLPKSNTTSTRTPTSEEDKKGLKRKRPVGKKFSYAESGTDSEAEDTMVKKGKGGHLSAKGAKKAEKSDDDDFIVEDAAEEEEEEEVLEEEVESSSAAEVEPSEEEEPQPKKRPVKASAFGAAKKGSAAKKKGPAGERTSWVSMEESPLPPITNHYDMFVDLVSNPLVLEPLFQIAKWMVGSGKRLRVATMCSGTESPLLALGMISKALKEKKGVELPIEHVFSCEIEPFKQACELYIERNFSPPILFRDVLELGNDYATTAYGAEVEVPGHVDLLVAGTSCVDYSNLNNKKKGIKDGGESGNTFGGMLAWVDKNKPPIVILENVCSAPWHAVVAEFDNIGYVAEPIRLDTKQYYIPHTRTRGYLMATLRDPDTKPLSKQMKDLLYSKSSKKKAGAAKAEDNAGVDGGDDEDEEGATKKKGKDIVNIPQPIRPDSVPGKWHALVKELQRPASAPLEAFLLPVDDPRILRVRQEALLGQMIDGTGRQVVDWGRCEGRHARARIEEMLGDKRPITGWIEGGGGTPMDFIWIDWASVQVERVLDLVDIFYLREAVHGRDVGFKTVVANLSQNVDRNITSGIMGVCGCLTPTGVPFPTNRGGPLIGVEALALQGIPVDQLLLTKETEAQLSDLAGNAMSSTVVGAAMVAALIVHFNKDVLKKAAKKKLKELEEMDVDTIEVQGPEETIPVGDLIVGEELLESTTLDIDHCAPMSVDDILQKATVSARLCTCEGRNDITSNDVQKCEKCGATSCKKCGGKPEHSYVDLDHTRIHPHDFDKEIKDVLPMRLSFDGVDTAVLEAMKEKVGAILDEVKWTEYHSNVKEAMDQTVEFRFETLLRQAHWIAKYDAPKAMLELHLHPQQVEWRLIVKPSQKLAMNSPIRALFQSPVARMKVAKEASSLLDGTWDFRLPINKSFQMTLKGEGERVPSWRSMLGLENFKEEKVFGVIDVSYPPDLDTILERPISGKYELLPHCGTATGILHKRKSIESDNDPRAMFFFLDPTRSKPYDKDGIVFSTDIERKDFGDFRPITAVLDPLWRPLKLQPTESTRNPSSAVNCHLSGQYINVPSIKLVTAVSVSSSVYSIPKEETTIVKLDETSCKCSQAFLTCEVPLSETQASEKWGRGEWYNVDVGKEGKEVFQDWSWITHRLPQMKIFNKWIAVEDNRSGKERKHSCDRCAPNAPNVVWVPDPNATGKNIGKKFIPVEDNRKAGKYEQALKHRPPPFVAQAMIRSQKGYIRVGINITSLIHRAMSLLPPPKPATGAMNFAWKLTTGHVAEAEKVFNAKAFKFRLESNKDDEEHDQPSEFETPLRREQLRSLTWMVKQEESPETFQEEEISEALLGPLGWRVEGKAFREATVKGGVLADEVGYGKTAITLGLISVMKEKKASLVQDGTEDLLVEGRISLDATLVVAPPHLTLQWRDEVMKFLGTKHDWNVITIENVAHLNKFDIRDFVKADLIIISATLFKTPLYWDNLAALAGMANLPDDANGGRHFRDQLRKCNELLKSQTETLVSEGKKGPGIVLKEAKDRLAKEAEMAEEQTLKAQGRRKKGKAYANAHNTGEDSEEEERPKKKSKGNPGGNDRLKADPWGLRNIEKWKNMSCPPLQMFHFARLVVDEFTYLQGRQYEGIVNLEAESRWVLSGTPPLGDFASVKSIAAFLKLHLGVDDDFEGAKETMKRRKKDKTSAEQFHAFREVHTTAWHNHRNQIGQKFLNQFVRQNLAEIDEIPFEDRDPEYIKLPAAERAIYLELDHHIASLELNAARIMKSKSKDATSDRDRRLAQAIGESKTPEEALLKRCSHFTLGVTVEGASMAGNAKKTCDLILSSRTDQRDDCKRELTTSLIEAVQMHRHVASSYAADENRHLEDWVKDVFKNGTGDPEANKELQDLLTNLGCSKEGISTKSIDFSKIAGKYLPSLRSEKKRKRECEEEESEEDSKVTKKLKKNPQMHSDSEEQEENATKPKKSKKSTAQRKKGKKINHSNSQSEAEEEEFASESDGETKGKKTKEEDSKDKKKKEVFVLEKWLKPRQGMQKDAEMLAKRFDLRERTHILRRLLKELVSRFRSNRYFAIIREIQKSGKTTTLRPQSSGNSSPVPSESSVGDFPNLPFSPEDNEIAILGTCGHHGVYAEVMREARLGYCTQRADGCRVIARKEQVVKASSLVGDDASGKFGVKLQEMVKLIKEQIPEDERILVFVQFADLLDKAKEAMESNGIDFTTLKGGATKMSQILNAFQKPLMTKKEQVGKKEWEIPRRVLLLNVGDSSASGANLTVANHAIFLNPLFTQTLRDYIAIETQAIGRVRRYGQRKKVHVHRLYTKDTIDEQILTTRTDQWAQLREEQMKQKEREAKEAESKRDVVMA